MIKQTLFLVTALLLGGCASSKNEPLKLRLAVNDIYCTQTACDCIHHIAARTYPETLAQLEKEFNILLQLDYFIEPYDLEDQILSGSYDGVLCKPWIALSQQEKTDTDFQRVVDILDPNNNQWLSGTVVVPSESPITTLDELNGKVVAYGQADGYEKHYAAIRLLMQKNIQPSQSILNASCMENLGDLYDGKADAAFISDYALSADCAVDFANPDDFRVIGYTKKIPLTSILLDMNKRESADFERLQTALLKISADGAPESLLSNGFVLPAEWNPPELME